MKAVFLDFATLGPGDIDAASLTRLLPGIALHPRTAREELAERVRDAEIVILNKVSLSEQVIARAPRLKLICLAATGTDNVALEAARARGIAVTNIRDYCAPSVTQHVFALILALTHRLREYESLLAMGAWSRASEFCLLDYPFHELAGKTLGIVGLGSLGGGVARVATAFGMQVLAARRPYRPAANRGESLADGVRRVGFPELLARSHIVSLHCPLTDETRHLIDAAAFRQMRPGALLINTARGSLVDSDALIAALRAGLIGGAGIDVLAREPPAHDDPLLQARLPNLIVTPHIAWAAKESRQRALEEIALNIAAFVAGERRNRLD
jgi:glycerate dehydrogenase